VLRRRALRSALCKNNRRAPRIIQSALRSANVTSTYVESVFGGGGHDAVVTLSPGKDYLAALSGMANKRMVGNRALIDRLLGAVRGGLSFPNGSAGAIVGGAGGREKSDGREAAGGVPPEYRATLRRILPLLNLWKTAAVILMRGGKGGRGVGGVDEHAKLKTKLKTKQSSQPRNPSPTCVSRVKWGQVSLIPDESQKGSHKGWSEGSHKIRGIPQRQRM
jgi:hypothetical protein